MGNWISSNSDSSSTEFLVDYTRLYEDDIVLLLNNSHYSESLIKQWHREFIAAFPDGKLSKEELKRTMRSYYKGRFYIQFENAIDSIFNYCNEDDGYINFVDFLVILSLLTRRASITDKLKLAFAYSTSDENEELTNSEIAELVNGLGKLMRKQVYSELIDKEPLIIEDWLNTNYPYNRFNKAQFVKMCLTNKKLCDLLGSQSLLLI
ncbi:hypothetical protein GJ496_010618 [Pomphorhynchus laevis]|nr:hypothetical protein GJ496_010618 [Pomphorhynchus laevis]